MRRTPSGALKMREALVTIGTFDGVHRGHQRLIRRLTRLAGKHGLRSLVVLFSSPPRFFFQPASATTLLTTPDERAELLRNLGVERVRILKFGTTWAKLSHEAFFEDFLIGRCRAGGLLVGADFAFGRGRLGDIPWLRHACRARGVHLWIQPLTQASSIKISSTRVRGALLDGDVEDAARLLGRPYRLAGRVVRGRGLGRAIGVPTANVLIPDQKLLPLGVYKVRASGPAALGRGKTAVCNVGTRPTVDSAPKIHVEAHIPGFRGDLYGRTLRLDFIKRIRPERRFPSLRSLELQIRKDIRSALR